MGESRTLTGHMPALDGVRGLAILLVMVFHFRAPDLPKWASAGLGIGWCGVDLFFVLSGFLITGILLDTRNAPRRLPVFWARRILRIFPLYFAALALLLAVAPPGWGPAAGDQRFYWLYLNNWLNLLEVREANHLLGHFWSLAVEEQFYLVWPVLVWLLPPRWILRASLAGMALAAAARLIALYGGLDPEAIYRGTIFRLDALLAGATCAHLVRHIDWPLLDAVSRRGLPASAIAAAAVIGLTRSTHYQNPWIQALGYPALSLCFAFLILQCVVSPRRHLWVSVQPLRWLGRYSYGLYVWHWPVAFTMLQLRGEFVWLNTVMMQAVGFVSSAALAWTSFRLLEQPMLNLKRRFTLAGSPEPERQRVFLSSSMSAGATSNRSPTMP